MAEVIITLSRLLFIVADNRVPSTNQRECYVLTNTGRDTAGAVYAVWMLHMRNINDIFIFLKLNFILMMFFSFISRCFGWTTNDISGIAPKPAGRYLFLLPGQYDHHEKPKVKHCRAATIVCTVEGSINFRPSNQQQPRHVHWQWRSYDSWTVYDIVVG